MNIVCIPVVDDRGLGAPVAPGLDAAAMFLLVDTASLAFRAVPNARERRRDRGGDPCEALDDTPVDAVIVQGIEAAARARLARRHLPVYAGATGTAADALVEYAAGRLQPVALEQEG